MSPTATATRKPAARKPAATKPQSAAKAAASKEQKPATKPVVKTSEPGAEKPEPKTLVEALTTGQASLTKVRANGTKRSLPYLALGSEERTAAEAVAKMREDGKTVGTIADDLKVSLATARRFLTNLALTHAVEAGDQVSAYDLMCRTAYDLMCRSVLAS